MSRRERSYGNSSGRERAPKKRKKYKVNWMRLAAFVILVILVVVLSVKCVSGCVNRDGSSEPSDKPVKENLADPSSIELRGDEPPVGEDRSIRGIPELKDVLTYDDGDLLVIVNKYHGTAPDYKPSDLVNVDYTMAAWDDIYIKKEAYDAYTKMYLDAEEQGYTLCVCSGYRTYEDQQELFLENLGSHGEEYAYMFSAYPGRSEHHTGLAIDVTSPSMDWALSQDFKDYPEGMWISEHCQDYGFILRYPEGKEDITGYSYEPWHFRYVGVDVAKEIMEKGITFEEYLGEA